MSRHIRDVRRGHYLRGDMAYTTDHVLIRRIYIKMLSEKLNNFLLYEYFSKFGYVEKAEILGYCSVSNDRFGYVQFSCGLAAAKTLQHHMHHTDFENYTMVAEPYDSWYQPDFEDTYAPPLPDEYEEITSVLLLNAYCLEGLLLQMTLSNQIRFSQVHGDIKDLFIRHYRNRFKMLALEDVRGITLLELRLLLDMIGEHVLVVRGEWPCYRSGTVMRIFIRGCPNLKGLKIDAEQLTLYDIEKFRAIVPKHIVTNIAFM